jgi:NAD(P)-dependent dehydrogenase (short-subunit alcohol dehydrogenase family)
MKSGSRIINVSSGAGSLESMSTYAPAYSISKVALNAITKQFAAALKQKNISVNSVCPGWVKTDMGGMGATRSVKKGAETIVWLANEAPINKTGLFWRDKKVIDW